MYYLSIKKEDWHRSLEKLLSSHDIFVPVKDQYSLDYEPFRLSQAENIAYNLPKPATPLKNFFLPVRENVSSAVNSGRPRIIIGEPNCDVEALGLLDEIYLDEAFTDAFYRNRRDSTLLISSDCFTANDHCHCTSYGVKPYAMEHADMAILAEGDNIFLRVISARAEELVGQLESAAGVSDPALLRFAEKRHGETEAVLAEQNKGLPDYNATGEIVKKAGSSIWVKYASKCVSCGACTTICPTCSCFLLIDKPGFEKVKQMDACQYPGFERVAGGEDVLFELPHRFRNRYMCKYVWRPRKFKSVACTGCGRCIEACIGRINKNELFMELT
ncbi:MAG: 4Fe-4S dicluster domain-containing protein [Bacteroidales bacterium]